jgi:hypothetical protein
VQRLATMNASRCPDRVIIQWYSKTMLLSYSTNRTMCPAKRVSGLFRLQHLCARWHAVSPTMPLCRGSIANAPSIVRQVVYCDMHLSWPLCVLWCNLARLCIACWRWICVWWQTRHCVTSIIMRCCCCSVHGTLGVIMLVGSSCWRLLADVFCCCWRGVCCA